VNTIDDLERPVSSKGGGGGPRSVLSIVDKYALHYLCDDDDDRLEEMSGNFSKFVSTLTAMRANGISQRWRPEFVTLLRNAHSAKVVPIDTATKDAIRTRKMRCAICGQVEKHCEVVVHLAGTPVDKCGASDDDYIFDARDWETSNASKLARNFPPFYDDYVMTQETEETGFDEEFPAQEYLGMVCPGSDCFEMISRTFTAQTMLLDVLYETYNMCAEFERQADDEGVDIQHTPGFTVTATRVADLREKWEQVVGVGSVPIDTSDVFWERLFGRFSKFAVDGADEESMVFCKAAYDRLEYGLGVCKSGNSTSSNKRRAVVIDDDDEEDDDDDDEEEDDDEQQRGHGCSSTSNNKNNMSKRTRRSCAKTSPYNDTERTTHNDDEEDEEDEEEEEEDEEEEEEEEEDCGSVTSGPSWERRPRATSSAKSTARVLRAPILESRDKTLKRLADLAYVLSDRKQFEAHSVALFLACATFKTLISGSKMSRFKQPTSLQVRDVLNRLADLKRRLLIIGNQSDDDEDGLAEAAIVTAAELTIIELSKKS